MVSLNFVNGGSKNSFKRNNLYKCPPENQEILPTFGFRTLVTIHDDEKCVPGISCTIDGYGVDKQNLTDSYSKSRNNTNSMRKEKIDFYPSEKFPWTDISFKNLVRKKRQGSKKAKISASQPYCKVFHTKSKKICGNKEP